MRKALYRHKSLPSIDKKGITKEVDTIALREKHFNTRYGRITQRAMDNGASFINALRLADRISRHKNSFGLQRMIYGGIKNDNQSR